MLNPLIANVLTSLIVLFVLSGCGSSLEFSTVAREKPKLELPEIQPYQSKPIDWMVITPENIDEVFQKFKDKNKTPVIFGLTDTGYENLSKNISELRTLIFKYNTIITAYQEYYEE